MPFSISERYVASEPRQYIVELNKTTSSLLSGNLSTMYSKHASITMLKLMYILTPEGRCDFRTEYPAAVISPDPKSSFVGRKSFNRRYDEQNIIIKYLDTIEMIRGNFENVEPEEDNDETSSDVCSDESSSDEEEEEEDESLSPRELQELNENGSLNEDDPTAFYVDALCEQLTLVHSSEEVDSAVQCLLNWIMMSTEELNIIRIYQGKPISIWTFF